MNPKYKERFLRSIGIFSESQLSTIKDKKIAIAGLGLGGAVFLNLIRLGFEKFHIADPDIYERTNINRQRGARETTIGLRKDNCLIKEAREINPEVQIKAFREGVKPHNLDAFLDGVDWVVDIVDVFAMEDKLALNNSARKKGLPVCSCATLGFSGSVIQFNSTTPSFAELTGIDPSLPYATNLTRFLQFMAPELPAYMAEQIFKAMDRESYIPFVTPGGEIAASFAASTIVKGILNIGNNVVAPFGMFVDSMNVETMIFEASYKARVVAKPESHLPQEKKSA